MLYLYNTVPYYTVTDCICTYTEITALLPLKNYSVGVPVWVLQGNSGATLKKQHNFYVSTSANNIWQKVSYPDIVTSASILTGRLIKMKLSPNVLLCSKLVVDARTLISILGDLRPTPSADNLTLKRLCWKKKENTLLWLKKWLHTGSTILQLYSLLKYLID